MAIMASEFSKPKLIDVEAVIKSKNPRILKWMPSFLLNGLKRIIHQKEMNDFLTKSNHLRGIEFTTAAVKELNITYHVIGLENIPHDGRYIFAANHPLGGLDGIILMDAIGKVFPKIKFPVNDLLMHINGLKPLFLPINKHGAQTQEAANLIDEAYSSDNQILMFPAGLVSRKNGKLVRDLEWKKNFVKKAIEHKRDIVPVYIDGNNSKFFYNLANIRKLLGIKINLEMLFLVDELFKQRNATITLRFGEPVAYNDFKDSKNLKIKASEIKELVYKMA